MNVYVYASVCDFVCTDLLLPFVLGSNLSIFSFYSFARVQSKKSFCLFVCFFINLFIYFWLCWVFVSVRALSPVAASEGHSSSQCTLSRPLLLRSTGSRRASSVVVAHGPSCSVACGIFPDQGSNPCPLHWQADSQPLRHQGSPKKSYLCLTQPRGTKISFCVFLLEVLQY